MKRDAKQFLKDFGLLLAIAIVLSTAFVYILNYRVKSTLSSAARLEHIKDFSFDFFQHYNNRDFRHIYDELTSGEFKEKYTFNEFSNGMNNIYNALGKTKSIKLYSYDFKSRQSYIKDKEEAHIILGYLTRNEKKDSLQEFTLNKEKNRWVLVTYNVTSEVPVETREWLDGVEAVEIE